MGWALLGLGLLCATGVYMIGASIVLGLDVWRSSSREDMEDAG